MKIGDQVVYKDDVGGGTVVRRDGQMLLVREESGFEDWYQADELLPKEDISIDAVSIDIIEIKESKQKGASKPHSNNHRSVLKRDLHLHVILDNTRGLTNHEKVMIQLKEAKKALLEARSKKYKYLHLIHGKGSGKLRQELHDWLYKQSVVDFYDMDISGNRSGVT